MSNSRYDQCDCTFLAERALGYRAFSLLFGHSIDDLTFQLAQDPQINDIWQRQAGEAACRDWGNIHAQFTSLTEAPVSALEGEYNRAFVGPGPLQAPLWESVYRTEDRLIFQESTLEVRRAYAAEGFVLNAKGSEPDDSLPAECEFLAALLEKAADAVEGGETEEASRLISTVQDFEEEHLRQWVGDFATALKRSDQTPTYAALASVLEGYV